MTQIVCANCGQALRPTDKFCYNCGAKVQPIKMKTEVEKAVPKPEPVKPEEAWTPEPAWTGVPEETGAEDRPHGSAFVNLTPDEEDKAE